MCPYILYLYSECGRDCCIYRVPRGCPSHRCKAKLKRSSSAARTDYVDYNHYSCKDTKAPFVYRGGGGDQNNSIHPLRKNVNVVTMPTHDVLLRHFRKA